MKKKLLIIYTGGTIGMQVTSRGYAPEAGSISTQLSSIDELHDDSMPDYDILEYQPLIDSSNATPDLWQKIANDIAQHYQDYQGFIVLHGTDTMAYSASALSFLLEGLTKPVIVTGSQVPLSIVRSDARQNLVGSVYLAGHYSIPEVCVFFNNSLMRGNRAVKYSAARYMAFKSPNYPLLADAAIEVDINKQAILPVPTVPFQCYQLRAVRIACVRLFPGFDVRLLESLLTQPLQALVLETYGTGNASSNDADLFALLRAARDKGVVLVNSSQCLHGAVAMGAYATGEGLQELGMISAKDMTVEAVLAKLHFLCSQYQDPRDVEQLMQQNLRGELTVCGSEAPEN